VGLVICVAPLFRDAVALAIEGINGDTASTGIDGPKKRT
jgi:hypothetical protein